MPVNTSAILQNQRLTAFSQNDLECLEHLSNVGHLVSDLMQVHKHYDEALAVDANGQLLSRYENDIWKVITPSDFARDVPGLFQRLRAPFSSGRIASVVETLKLIIPRQDAPARRLIGFRNGVLDTRSGIFSPHSKSHWLRNLCDVDFTPPVEGETLETHAPNFWRWLDRAASGNPTKRNVILAALFMVLANRYDWQLFLEVTGPGGSGKSILAEIATMLAGEGNATSADIDTLEDPMSARALLQSQQNSDEALSIKRDADPTFDFCGYLEALPQTNGMFMGNASIIPRNYRKYLYHAYLAYMEANGYRNVLSLKMFGLGLPMMLKEYGMNYEKRHTKQGSR